MADPNPSGWWDQGAGEERRSAGALGGQLKDVFGTIALAVTALARRHGIEAFAAACGLAGAWLLATKGQYAAWGWWAFLASNVGWIAFGWIRRHWFLLLQQVGFTASSVWGIWKWMGAS